MNVLEFIAGIFKPFADLVDNVHTSTEEKMQLKNELAKTTNAVNIKLIELESQLIEAQAKVLTVEMQSDSWLGKNWRPTTMLIFVSLIVSTWLGFNASGLTEAMILKLLDIVQVGLGGYVIGRSVEKVAFSVKDMLKK